MNIARTSNVLVGILLIAQLTLLGLFPVGSEDTWWHLKEGELYVTTMSLPDQDPFAFTTTGREWTHYSWVADILFYLIFRASDVNGLILFRLALLFAIAYALYKLLRGCGLHPYACVLLVFLASLTLRFRLLIRPEILAFFFLLVVIAVLLRLQTGPVWAPYLLLPIEVVWANIHASFIFGIGIPVLVLVANLLPTTRVAPGWDRLRFHGAALRHLAISALLLPFVSLLNPHGIELLLFPIRQNRMIRLDTFTEWMGVWNLPRLGSSWWEILIALGVVVLTFVVTAVLLLAWEGRFDPVGWGIVVCMGTYAVFRCRAVPFFVLAILPLLALALVRVAGHVLKEEYAISYQQLQRIGALACLLVLGGAVLDQGFLSSRFLVGFGMRPNFFPEGAVAFLERHRLNGRVFNTYHFGGYLMWCRWPANQVFIDGRYDAILFDEQLLEEYDEAHRSRAALDQLAEKYAFEILVLDVDRAFRMEHIQDNPMWARVYWDPVAEVYVRRGGRFDSLVALREYRLTKSTTDLAYLKAYRGDPHAWTAAISELRRAVEDNPENVIAWQALAQEYGAAGPTALGQRLDALSRALALLPDHPTTGRLHAERAEILLQLGQFTEAEMAARKALRLDRGLLLPWWVLATVAERQGAWKEAREYLHNLLGRIEQDHPMASRVQERLNGVEKQLQAQGAK